MIMSGISVWKARLSPPVPIRHQSPRLLVLYLPRRMHLHRYSHDYERVKDISVNEFGLLLSQLSDSAIADAEEPLYAGGDLA